MHFNFPAPSKERESQVSNDYKGLFNDRNFENTITKRELFQTASKARGNGLIRSIVKIIETIDKGLKDRQL